jgi:hypothetical protein
MNNNNNINYHCFVCDLVYYAKEKIWLEKKIFDELDMNETVRLGVYHKNCIDNYLVEYLNDYLLPLNDVERIAKGIEKQINELEK